MTPHRDEMLTEDTPSFLTETCRKFKKKAQIVAVASAIGDVIEEQNGPLVPASFFGVIITSLSDGKEKTEDEIANLLSLLSFVLEKASAAILRVKFSHVCGVLLNIFSQCPESAIILAKLASCISLLLQAQDPNTLHQKEAMSCIHFLLSISSDERNGVSRAAHVGLLSIFKSSNASTRKLVSGALYQFVHKLLTSQPTPSEGTLVSILRLVKIVFRYLSANHIGTLCEDILRLPVLAISSVTAASFQSILALINESEEEEEEGLITLQAPQLISLVDTLADMQPHFNDTKPLIEYAILIGHLFSELARADGNACAKRLPAVVERLIINFAGDNNEIKQITHDALVTIVNGCISEDMIKQALASPKAPLRSVIESLESSLSPKYNRSWDKGLLVIAALFDKLGVHSGEMLGSILATVGELYNTLTPQTHMPVFAVLGFAISSMGPKKFLEILPLNLDAPEAQSGPVPNRAWLLPLLRSNIEETDLKFFVDYFIPLANQVTAWSKRAESVGRLVEAKNKQILHDQIWDLFPSFCNLPIDIAQNFKTIARTLGTLLKDTDSLRKVLCTGLLKLIEKHMEVAALTAENPESRVTIAIAKASLKAIAQFATNFLPILFSIFEKLGPTDNKDTLFNLITAYLKISEPQAVSNFFRKLMEKLLEASTELKKEEDDDEMEDDEKELRRKEAAEAEKARKALVDSYSALSSAFVPSLSIGDLDFLFRVIKPFFKSNVVHTQKKAYKILRGMCTREVFVKKNYEEVRGLVVRSSECSSAAKKQRVFVLSELQSHMAIEEVTSPSLLADIIFCSREINAAARKVALQMIVAIAHRVQTEDAESGLKNYLNLVIAGLAGTTPVMISGSISALTALVTEFKDVISPIFIKDLFFTMTVLLRSKYSEVLSETISFLKATMSMVDADDMKPALKQLADGFAYMMQEHKGKFRDYGVHVMVKLMKRYGYDTLVPLFPEDCHKVLRAINKRENKKKDKSSKKDKDSEGEESDSDESDSEFVGDNLVGGNKIYEQQDQPETFIIEDEEPLDFLDKQAMKRVISAKPQEQKEKQKKKKSEFKMLPDGRLLIQDSDDDEDSHNIYFDKTSEKLPIDDRLMDSVDRELFGSKSRRMTKKRMLENDRKVEDADSDDEVDQVRPMNEKFKRNSRPKATPKYAGHQFKAQKAGGDIKIGKLEPFAYIPLDVRNLNKRRRHQAVNTFKPISKSSKKTTN